MSFSEGDEIQAYITLGGFQVYSDKVKAGGSIYEQFIKKSNDFYLDLSLTSVTFSNGITQSVSVISEDRSEIDWNNISYQLSGQTLTVTKTYNDQDPWDTRSKNHTISFNFSPDFATINSVHVEKVDVYENSSTKSTWTASFDITNVPHDVFFGSPGGTGALDFSRYTEDDYNGLRNNLKNFKYKIDYYYKDNNTSSTDQVVSIDLYNAPIFEKNYFWVWFRKTN